MSNDSVNLNTFPSNKYEALAFLYLQSQDISNLTPEELIEKYYEVYRKIYSHYRDARQNNLDWIKTR